MYLKRDDLFQTDQFHRLDGPILSSVSRLVSETMIRCMYLFVIVIF